MDVHQLEEGNRALREHVNQLEAMIALKTGTSSSMQMSGNLHLLNAIASGTHSGH
jgi:hypothetical protein